MLEIGSLRSLRWKVYHLEAERVERVALDTRRAGFG